MLLIFLQELFVFALLYPELTTQMLQCCLPATWLLSKCPFSPRPVYFPHAAWVKLSNAYCFLVYHLSVTPEIRSRLLGISWLLLISSHISQHLSTCTLPSGLCMGSFLGLDFSPMAIHSQPSSPYPHLLFFKTQCRIPSSLIFPLSPLILLFVSTLAFLLLTLALVSLHMLFPQPGISYTRFQLKFHFYLQ